MSVQQVLVRNDTRTNVTNEQSQRLVQTMLTMSFGCVAYLRGLFDDDCFKDQRFVANKNDGNSRHSIRIKTLIKGKSREVDTIFKWLENGIFPAIQEKYLKAFYLSVFTDPENPNDLLETYTFSFDYGDDDDVTMHVSNDDCSSKLLDCSLSLLDSRKAVEQLMRRLIIITQTLPSLPSNRNISIRLLFNDNCPKDYQPSSIFRDASFERPATLNVDSLALLETSSAGEINTFHHKVGVKIINSQNYDKANHNRQKIIKVDPFDLIENENPAIQIFSRKGTAFKRGLAILNKKKNSSQPLENTQSQTTKELKNFLNPNGSSEMNNNDFKSTQALTEQPEKFSRESVTSKFEKSIEGYNCECGSKKPIISIESKKLQCSACHKNVHASCYGYDLTLKNVPEFFKCFTCRCHKNRDNLLDELPILMNVRKIYRLIMKWDIPESLSSLLESLGYTDLTNIIFLESVFKALTILFNDEILIIESEPIKKAKYSKSSSSTNNSKFIKGSDFINIDMNGVYVGFEPLPMGKYSFTFTPLAVRSKSCFEYKKTVEDRKNYYFNETLNFFCKEGVITSDDDQIDSSDHDEIMCAQRPDNTSSLSENEHDPIVESSQFAKNSPLCKSQDPNPDLNNELGIQDSLKKLNIDAEAQYQDSQPVRTNIRRKRPIGPFPNNDSVGDTSDGEEIEIGKRKLRKISVSKNSLRI